MEVAGTKAAFLQLISQPGFAKKSGYKKSTVSLWKSRSVTIDKMEEILEACGATVVQEKVWDVE